MAKIGKGVVGMAMALGVVGLSFSAIFITHLESLGVPALAIAFYRMLIVTVLFAAPTIVLRRRELSALEVRDWTLIFLAGVCLAIHFGAWITSLRYIPISTSVVLVNSHPLFVILAAYFFLRERPSRQTLFGVGMGLAGVLVIGWDGIDAVSDALTGDALALVGAVSVAGYFVLGRGLRQRVGLAAYVTPLYAVCTVLLFVWALIAGSRLTSYGREEWIYFAALAIVPTIFGHTIFNWSLKHVRPSTVSVAFLCEPILASVLAFLIFSQTPPVATVYGGILILLGTLLTAYGESRSSTDGTGDSRSRER